VILALAGCSDDAAGPGTGDGDVAGFGIDGSLDPGDGTFVLQTLDEPMPGDDVVMTADLIGSNLVVDAEDQTVSIDVAIRNRCRCSFYAPAWVWLDRFLPPGVMVLNADAVEDPTLPDDATATVAPVVRYGFDYGDLLGDGILSPLEVSETKTWVFHVPGLTPFSFAAHAQFGAHPDLPLLSGRVFHDLDLDGLHDEDEPGLPAGIEIRDPDGTEFDLLALRGGRYALPVERPGLYEIRCSLHLDWPAGIAIGRHLVVPTTPNPLQVLLPPAPGGGVTGFHGADFGFGILDAIGPCWRALLTDRTVAELQRAPWDLLAARVEGDQLLVEVGYSGCHDQHPFALFMSGAFMESDPPRARITLVHPIDELCEAYWTEETCFDLGPIRRAYVGAYGEPVDLILELVDSEGEVTELSYGP
jgi:hypothetical protein